METVFQAYLQLWVFSWHTSDSVKTGLALGVYLGGVKTKAKLPGQQKSLPENHTIHYQSDQAHRPLFCTGCNAKKNKLAQLSLFVKHISEV